MENTKSAGVSRRDLLRMGTVIGGAVALGGVLAPVSAATSKPFSRPTRSNPLVLNTNENAYGCSMAAQRAVEKYKAKISSYPGEAESMLCTDISSTLQINEDSICLTNGASAGIQAAVFAVNRMALNLNMPLRVLVSQPNSGLIDKYTQSMGIEVMGFGLDSKFNIDIDAMKEAERKFDGISLVYISNPNDPTSNIVSANDLYSWIRTANNSTIFLLDERYAEYVTSSDFKSGIDMLKEGAKNLITVRTFSRIFGLAGLRVGYVLSSSQLKRQIDDFLQIHGINVLGAVAASASLKDFGFRQYCVNSNIKSRQIVTKALDSLELKHSPSHANFVFHEVMSERDVFMKALKDHNIIVDGQFAGYDSFFRVTLGTPDEMRYYTDTLKTLRKKRLV